MLEIHKNLILVSNILIYYTTIKAGAEKIRYMTTEHPKITWSNPKYFRYANLTSQRYSRTDPFYYIGCHLDSIWPVHYNANIHFVFYEFLSNQYKPSFVELHYPLCDLAEKDIYFGISLSQFFPHHRCPLEPGAYHFSNITIPLKSIPHNFPFSKGRLKVNLTSTSQELMLSCYIDLEIKELSSNWRKNKKNLKGVNGYPDGTKFL